MYSGIPTHCKICKEKLGKVEFNASAFLKFGTSFVCDSCRGKFTTIELRSKPLDPEYAEIVERDFWDLLMD